MAQGAVDSNLRLTRITSSALKQTVHWVNSEQRKYDWDWKANYSYYRAVYPKRFEVAVWESRTLTAISLGRPTYNATG